MFDALFGSRSAKLVLFYLQTYGEGYGREIARTFSVGPLQIQNQLTKLEAAGWLVSRPIGRARVYGWNPRNPLIKLLRALLQDGLDALPESEIQDYYRQRRRPRKAGKAL